MTDLHLPDANQILVEDYPACLVALAALQAQIAARLIAERSLEKAEPAETDVMLTAAQAAELLGVSRAWMYKRSKHLPFTRKLSYKGVRFSKRGLLAWRDRRRP